MKYKLKAKEEFFYGGKTHKVGDHFEAVDPDARVLVATNKAEDVTKKAAEAAPTYQTQEIKAEEKPAEPVTTDDVPTTGRTRRYARRDMTSEK
jgi:hypothetical protein